MHRAGSARCCNPRQEGEIQQGAGLHHSTFMTLGTCDLAHYSWGWLALTGRALIPQGRAGKPAEGDLSCPEAAAEEAAAACAPQQLGKVLESRQQVACLPIHLY